MKNKVDMKLNSIFDLANGMEEHNTMNNKFSPADAIGNFTTRSDFFGLGGLLADGSVHGGYKGIEGPDSEKFTATISKNQIYINAGIAGSAIKTDRNGKKGYPANRMYGRFDRHQGDYRYYGAGVYKTEEVNIFMAKNNIMDAALVSNQYLLASHIQDDKTPYELLDTNRLALGCINASMARHSDKRNRQTDNTYSLVVDTEYNELIDEYWTSSNEPRKVTLVPHDINSTLGIIFITERQ